MAQVFKKYINSIANHTDPEVWVVVTSHDIEIFKMSDYIINEVYFIDQKYVKVQSLWRRKSSKVLLNGEKSNNNM